MGSDHLPVIFQICVNGTTKNNHPSILDYRNFDWKLFRSEINDKINLNTLERNRNQINAENVGKIDSLVQKFNEIVISFREAAVPKLLLTQQHILEV